MLKPLADLVRPLPTPKGTPLYHGTSIETVLEAARTGWFGIPEFKHRDNFLPGHANYLFFFPTKACYFPTLHLSDLFVDPDMAAFRAQDYANQIGFRHCVYRALGEVPPQSINYLGVWAHERKKAGLDSNYYALFAQSAEGLLLADKEDGYVAQESTAEAKQLLAHLEPHGYDAQSLAGLLNSASYRRGVLVGFSEEILELEIVPGLDDPDNEVCIFAPRGFDAKYVNQIVPLGNIEYAALTGLGVWAPSKDRIFSGFEF